MPKTFHRPPPPPDDESFQRWARPTPEPWDDVGDVADGRGATSWEHATHGPEPRPSWVVESFDARDEDLGPIKSGKEAECRLIHRAEPGDPGSLLVAKRYRRHGGFTRDALYREGRKVEKSREQRAIDRRTDFGRALAATEWAAAEFAALSRLWQAGVTVPYPVQLLGRELMMEYVGDHERTAPRLVDARLPAPRLRPLVGGLVEDLRRMTAEGLVHADLSPYNLLVWQDRLWIIDVPQTVELATNPHGLDLLHRDVVNVATWFGRKGVDVDADDLFVDLMREVPGWG